MDPLKAYDILNSIGKEPIEIHKNEGASIEETPIVPVTGGGEVYFF